MATIKGIKVGGPIAITASYGGLSSSQNITVTALSLATSGVCTISGLSNITYDGAAHKTNPVVKVTATGVGTNVTLTKDTDYTVSWNSSSDSTSCITVGTITVTVTGKGNYTGTKTATYQITNASFTVTAPNQTYPYDGSAHGSAITVSNLKGSQTATIRYRTASSGDYTLTSPPTRSAAGSQTVYWQVTAPNHATQTGSYTLEITAVAPTLTFTPVSGTLTYNGQKQNIGTVNYNGDGTAEYVVTTASSAPSTGWATITNGSSIQSSAATAGTYNVYLRSSAGSNYTAVTAFKAGSKEISQAAGTFTWTAAGTLTYNGLTQVLGTLKYTGDGTPSYAVTTSATVPSSGWTEMSANTNVNISSSAETAVTYYIHVKATAGTNYSAVTAVNKANKAIGKKTPTLTFTAASGTLTYNGSQQNIGTVNYDGDGTAKYVVNTSSTAPAASAVTTAVTNGTTIKSSAANAGTYYVYLIATEGTNYTAVSNVVSAGSKVISNATITVKTSGESSVINQSYVYTGSAQGVGLTATTIASQTATIKYGTEEGSYTTSTVPTRTTTGNQTVYYQVTAPNHTTVTGSYSLAITNATFTVSEPDQTYTYNGNPQGAAITVSNIKGGQTATIRYRTASSGDYTLTSAPQLTAAGSQTVYWQVTVPNHTTQSGSYTLTINKATPTMALLGNIVTPSTDETSPSGIEYHGTAYIEGRASVVGKIYWGTSTSSMTNVANVTTASSSTYNTSITTRETLGTTTVYAYFVPTDTANYNTLGSSSSYHASAAAKIIESPDNDITVELKSGLYYTGAAQVIAEKTGGEGVAHFTLGYSTTANGTVTWGTEDSTTLSVADPGTYYIHYKLTPDSNHSTTINDKLLDGTVVIGSGTLTITVTGYSGTYDGSAHNVVATGGGPTAKNQANQTVTGVTYTYSTSETGTYGSMPTRTSATGTSANESATVTYWVKAEKSGYTTVTKSFTVFIGRADNPLTITPTSKTIYNTSGYNTFTITPSGAQGSVSYASSATSKATVNSSGLVTYVAAGSATITVTAAGNGNYKPGSKTCTVTTVVDTVSTYGDISGTITINQKKQFPAGGVSLSTTNITTYFEYTSTCAQTLTWASGNTTNGSISYAWSGTTVSIPSLDTDETSAATARTISFTVTATGQGNKTKTATVSTGDQEANPVTAIALTLGSNSIIYGSSTTATVTATYKSGASGPITPTSLVSADDTIAQVIS